MIQMSIELLPPWYCSGVSEIPFLPGLVSIVLLSTYHSRMSIKVRPFHERT